MLKNIFLVITAFILLGLTYSIPHFYLNLFGNLDITQFSFFFFFNAAIFLFYFCIPFLINRFVLQQTNQQAGLCLPKNKKTTSLYILLGLCCLLPPIFYLTRDPQIHAFYSLHQLSLTKILYLQFISAPIYYICEEFFFRGFLFLTLLKRWGWHSYWITDLLFVTGHIAKPILEIYLSFPAGILLAFLTARTKSIWPAVIVHTIAGVTLSILINGV